MNQRRLDLIEILGGMECRECGNYDERVLQIDHIFGNGQEMPLNKTEIMEFYILNPDIAFEELQVLCANCHIIKTLENGDRYKGKVKIDNSLDLSIIREPIEEPIKERIRCNLMKEYLESTR